MINCCHFCGSSEIFYDSKRAEYVCKRCSMVISNHNIGGEDNSNLVANSNISVRGGGMSTVITRGNSFKDYKLKKIEKNNQYLNSYERTLSIALNILNRNSSNLGIPQDIKKDASYFYKKALKSNLIRGRSIEGVVAACLHISCKIRNVPRSLDEISEVSNVNRRFIARMVSVLMKELNIKIPPATPGQFIPRFASKLNLPNEVEIKAHEIIYDATQMGLTTGKDPVSIAAAALYMASAICSFKRSQKEISEITGISDVTIRKRYKELAEKLNLEIIV